MTYLRFYQSCKSLQWHIHCYIIGLQPEKRHSVWYKGSKIYGRKAKTKAQYRLDWWNQNPTWLHQYWTDTDGRQAEWCSRGNPYSMLHNLIVQELFIKIKCHFLIDLSCSIFWFNILQSTNLLSVALFGSVSLNLWTKTAHQTLALLSLLGWLLVPGFPLLQLLLWLLN